MFDGWFDGKVVAVTGAGRGIGRAIAIAFSRAGAGVALASRTVSELETAADEIRSSGGAALVVPTDASVEAQMEALVDRTVDAYGTLDVMVNNAGVAPFLSSFLDTGSDAFAEQFGINFWSAVYGTRAAGRVLLPKGSGSVLNIASIDAFMVEPGLTYYGAAKAAIVNLTKSVALEWAPRGVRVNAIAPGWVDTSMNEAERDDPSASEQILSAVPLARWGRVDEIANAALFLCSDEASGFTTGELLVIDGGQTLTSSRSLLP